jgi:hypothetical protein
MVLENEGHPLWNGKDEIFPRKAFPEEEARFDASQARAIKNGEIDDEDAGWLMYSRPSNRPDRRCRIGEVTA